MIRFEIGQLVVAIEDLSEKDPGEPPPWLEVGRIYTISGFCTKAHEDSGVGILLEEVSSAGHGHPGYCECFWHTRFRPVKPTDICALRELVKVKPKEPVV
jgi:hypothetical protein